jgi:hypothetical protein
MTRLSEREESNSFYTQRGIVIVNQLVRDFTAFKTVNAAANAEVDAGKE